MEKIKMLSLRLRKLEEEILEVKRRLPAHSVKPPLMGALMNLEDEYDGILLQLDNLKGKEIQI